MLKFCIKVFKISQFLNSCMDLRCFIFGMIIDIGPKYYSALSPPYDLEVKVPDLEILS